MPSSTTNSNERKRRGISLSNSKKVRRAELMKKSTNERQCRSVSISDSLTKLNHITQEYSLSTDINRFSTFRQINNSYEVKRDIGSNTKLSQDDEIKSHPLSSYDTDEQLDKTKSNSNKISSVLVSPIITSSDLTKTSFRPENNSSTKLFKLVGPQVIHSSSSIKMLTNGDGLSSALRIPTKIQLTKTLTQNNNHSPCISTANLSSNQKQLNDSSSTRDITEKKQAIVDYPLTPPPPVVDNSHKTIPKIKGIEQIDSSVSNEHQPISKRHSYSLSDWSVPPTSELSPTSLTSSSPDDSFVELDLKIHHRSSSSSIKRRYRQLSFSCPILPYCIEKTKPITPPYKSKSLSRISNISTKILRSMSPVIKYSSIERLKRRRRDHQMLGKRFKLKSQNENGDIKEILNEIIEQIELINDEKDRTSKRLLDTPVLQFKNPIQIEESPSTVIISKEPSDGNLHEVESERDNNIKCMNHLETKTNHQTILRRSRKSTRDENLSSLSTDFTDNSFSIELNRQTSTPLSFHSIASSSADEQSLTSPHSVSKTHIFTDIVNELIKGAKGLDKLSCSLINFTNSIHHFIRLNIDKQNEKVDHLQQELDKKCSSQLTRANLFCTKKIQYFLNKHSLISINEYINEITLIVKYFYLYVLSLSCRKQENEYELILNDLILGKLTFINESFSSSILTTIIEDFILTSTLANDYLLSQPMILNQIEYSLPLIRNLEYENELLSQNDTSLIENPFSGFSDLEDYLNCCEHVSTTIPYYPIQQSPHPSMYYSPYPPSGQYYYPPTPSSDMIPYYYHPPSYSNYPYNHPSNYYHPLTPYGTPYHEQFHYYYNQQIPYNSTNDIPLSHPNSFHQAYRRMHSNIPKKYSNSPPAVFDSAQSKSTTYPS